MVRASSAVVALVALLAVGAYAAPQHYFRSHVAVSSPGHDGKGLGSHPPRPKTTTSIKAIDVNPHATTTTVAPGNGASTTTITVPTIVPPGRGSTPTTVDSHQSKGSGDNNGVGDHGGSGGETTTTTPSTTVPSGDRTFTSAGGSVTIHYDGRALTLVSYHAASGYHAQVDSQKADDIEVQFRSSEQSWRIRIRIENGQVTPEISHDD